MAVQPVGNSLHGVVLAAGYGTRMKVLSDCKSNKYAVTKVALPAGRRTLVRQLFYMLHCMGVREATLVVKYKPETVLRAVGDDAKFELKYDVYDMNKEQVEDWGSAWTVHRWLSSRAARPERMVVLSGDILWNKCAAKPFADSFMESKADAQILVSEMCMAEIFGRFGMVQLDDEYLRAAHQIYFWKCAQAAGDPEKIAQARQQYELWMQDRLAALRSSNPLIRHFVEKPEAEQFWRHVGMLANVGVFGITRKALERFAPGNGNGKELGRDFADFSRHLFQEGLLKEKGCSLEAHIPPSQEFYWRDVGTPFDLMRANRDIMHNLVDAGPQGTEIKPGVWIGNNVQISDWALEHIEGPVIIADNVVIGRAKIGPNVVIGKGWVIRDGAEVSDSLLLPSYYPEDDTRVVGLGARVSHCIVAGGTVGNDAKFNNGIIVVAPDNTMSFHGYDFIGERG